MLPEALHERFRVGTVLTQPLEILRKKELIDLLFAQLELSSTLNSMEVLPMSALIGVKLIPPVWLILNNEVLSRNVIV